MCDRRRATSLGSVETRTQEVSHGIAPGRRGGQNLTLVDPSREFEDIYDRMGQLLSFAFGDLGLARPGSVPWSPLAEVSETDDAYLVHVELPGIRKDQVDVQLVDRELVISGDIKESENGRRRRSSRRTGRFEYRTYLPADIKADQVSAQLADGVLTVTVPKSEATKPRRIEVKASEGAG
jgi:HSP20 family protein